MATFMTKEEISKLADAFVKKFNEMDTLELYGLTKSLEKAFGFGAAPRQSAQEVVQEEEKTEYSVLLKSEGEKRIKIIKAIRAEFLISLKEAKTLVEQAPVLLVEDYSQGDAEKLKKTLEDLGATVEVK